MTAQITFLFEPLLQKKSEGHSGIRNVEHARMVVQITFRFAPPLQEKSEGHSGISNVERAKMVVQITFHFAPLLQEKSEGHSGAVVQHTISGVVVQYITGKLVEERTVCLFADIA